MKIDNSLIRNCPLHGAHTGKSCPICGSSGRVLEQSAPSRGVDKESKLHAQIIKFCNDQWPRWKYIHSRMDKASTTEKGTPDFAILAPQEGCNDSRTLFIECKAKGGKLSSDQRNWRHEAETLGHTVYTCYCFDDFLSVLRDLNLTK